MTTTVAAPGVSGYPNTRAGLGIFTGKSPCGTVWGHEGAVPGYVNFAFHDRSGSRSAIVLVPTEPDDAIGAAFAAAIGTALCQMFERDPSPASLSAAAYTRA